MKHLRFVFVVLAVMLALLSLPQPAQAATCTWDGTVGDWSNAAKWTGCGGGVPGAADTAVISSGTVTLDIPVTVAGLTFNGGTLTGANDITITGAFQWSGGALSGSGNANANGGITFSGASGHTLSDTRVLNNAGTMNFNATTYLYMQTGSPVFNNLASGALNVQSASTYVLYGSAGTFNNAGTLTKSASGDTQFYVGTFNNTGTVNITGAGVTSLNISNLSTHSGPFSVAANATLSFVSGTHDLNAGADVSGAGTVSFTGGTVNLHATYNVTGVTSVAGGTANFLSDSTLTSLGTLNISSGTLDLSSGESPTISSFTMSAGTLKGSDSQTVSTFNWSAGTLSGFGTTTVNPTFNVTGSGSRTLSESRVLNNAGTLAWNSTGYIYLQNNAVFNNQAGASFNVSGAGTYLFYGSAGTVNNAGTLTKSASGDTQVYAGSFNNSGTVSLTGTGKLSLNQASPSSHSGPFQVGSNATLSFVNGTHDLNAGANVAGAGSVDFSSTAVNLHSTYNITGTTIMASGAANFFSDATLTSLGTLNISGGTLDLSSGESPTISSFTMSAGTLKGSDSQTVSTFNWSAGTLSGFGTTTVNPTFNVTGSGSRTLSESRVLNNAGTLAWNSTGYIYLQNNAVFNNQAGASFNVSGAGTYLFYGSAGTVNNAGTLTKSASGDTQVYAGSFNNSGTVNITGTGTFALNQINPSSHSGPFQVGSSATLSFVNGTHDLNSGASISGAGSVNFSSTAVNLHSTYNITGTTTMASGAANFFSDATLTSLGTLNISGGTLDLSSGESPTISSFTMSGGTLKGSDSQTVSTFNWSAGALSGFGTTTVNPTFNVTGSSSRTLSESRVLNNAGTLAWNSTGYTYLQNNAVFNNQAGASFNVSGAGTYLFYGSAGTVNNAGTFTKSASGDTQVYAGSFNNSGTVSLTGTGKLSLNQASPSGHSGPFAVGAGAILSFVNGTHDLNAGANVTGAGSVDFSSTAVNLHSTYNITGTTTMASGAASFFSDATLTGLGTLNMTGGTLNLSSGESPAINSFTMSGGTLTGSDSLSVENFTWTGGTLSGSGTLTVNTALDVTGTSYRTLSETRTLSNAGTLTWNSAGYIYMQNTPTFNNLAGATFDVVSNGAYLFYGNNGTLRNAGTLNLLSSGYLTMAHFIQTASGVIHFGLDSTTVGTGYPQIYATDAALDGAAVITLDAGYSPVFRDKYSLIYTSTTPSGRFAVLTLPLLEPGLVWHETYAANGWSLSAFKGLFLPMIVR